MQTRTSKGGKTNMIANILRPFKASTQFRLTIYFLLILVPLVAISLYSNVKSKSILEKQTADRTQNAMMSAMDFIDLTLRNGEELSRYIVSDSVFNRMLDDSGTQLTPETILNFQSIQRQVVNMTNLNQALAQTALLHTPTGLLITSSGYQKIDNVEQQEWFQQTVKAGGSNILFLPEEDRFNLNLEPDPIYNHKQITLMRLMDMSDPFERRNIVMVSIKKEALVRFFRPLVTGNNGRAYLYADDRRLVAGTDSEPFQPDWNTAPDQTFVHTVAGDGQKMLLAKVTSPKSNWTLVMVQPEGAIFRQSKQLQQQTIIIILVSVAIALWISWIVYSNISSPLKKMISGMKQIRQNQLDARLVHRRQDEFGYLMDQFNEMAHSQKHLIRNGYEQQLRLMKTELKLLQSQVHPHFL
jgi:two-component system sensor histidine kinase YesM